MSENISLTNLVNLQNETTAVNAINSNNAAITTAFTDVLSRSGESPNQMGSPLDMNSNRIINLPSPVSTSEPVTLSYMNTYLTTGEGVTGLTGVPVSAAMQPVVDASTTASAATLMGIPPVSTVMQPVVNASTIAIAQSLLGIGGTSVVSKFITPEQFGASNSIADNTTALQNAISQAESTNSILLLSAFYPHLSTLNITSPITIMGTGTNVSGFAPATGVNCLDITLAGNNSVSLSNFQIEYGTVQTNAAAVGIDHQCAASFTGPSLFDNIQITNAYFAMQMINTNGNTTIRNSVFNNYYGAGIVWTAPVNADGGDCPIQGNLFSSSQTSAIGIILQSGGGLRISNNKLIGNQIGIDVQWATATGSLLMINNNSIENYTLYGIRMYRQGSTGSQGNIIINCNELSGSTSSTAGIFIPTDSNGVWINTVNICNNIGIQTGNSSYTFISVDSVYGFTICNNTLVSGGGSIKKINVGSDSDGGVVGPNAGRGSFVTSTINSSNTTSIAPN